MSTPLDEIEFLARSEYRGSTLEALAEEPLTRGGLREATDASQPTLGRVLDDLTSRYWIDQDDQYYTITPAGRAVAEAFTTLVETISTEQKLREITPFLPLEVMDFPFTCLADATVTVPTRAVPSAPIERNLDLLAQATHVRSLSYSFVDQALQVLSEGIVEGTQNFEGITTQHAVDELSSTDVEAVLTPENGQLYIHGDIPSDLGMAITDRFVTFLVRNEQDVLQALVVTDNKTVRTWAEEIFNQYRSEADPAEASLT